ncbi:MAG: hypothetical protein EYC62_03635 [Alphaproteobacteria bacterium]|nr:MAG: hypothetical protein EYC62_03635 [Alphaproteobacteria bacterium]
MKIPFIGLDIPIEPPLRAISDALFGTIWAPLAKLEKTTVVFRNGQPEGRGTADAWDQAITLLTGKLDINKKDANGSLKIPSGLKRQIKRVADIAASKSNDSNGLLEYLAKSKEFPRSVIAKEVIVPAANQVLDKIARQGNKNPPTTLIRLDLHKIISDTVVGNAASAKDDTVKSSVIDPSLKAAFAEIESFFTSERQASDSYKISDAYPVINRILAKYEALKISDVANQCQNVRKRLLETAVARGDLRLSLQILSDTESAIKSRHAIDGITTGRLPEAVFAGIEELQSQVLAGSRHLIMKEASGDLERNTQNARDLFHDLRRRIVMGKTNYDNPFKEADTIGRLFDFARTVKDNEAMKSLAERLGEIVQDGAGGTTAKRMLEYCADICKRAGIPLNLSAAAMAAIGMEKPAAESPVIIEEPKKPSGQEVREPAVVGLPQQANLTLLNGDMMLAGSSGPIISGVVLTGAGLVLVSGMSGPLMDANITGVLPQPTNQVAADLLTDMAAIHTALKDKAAGSPEYSRALASLAAIVFADSHAAPDLGDVVTAQMKKLKAVTGTEASHNGDRVNFAKIMGAQIKNRKTSPLPTAADLRKCRELGMTTDELRNGFSANIVAYGEKLGNSAKADKAFVTALKKAEPVPVGAVDTAKSKKRG